MLYFVGMRTENTHQWRVGEDSATGRVWPSLSAEKSCINSHLCLNATLVLWYRDGPLSWSRSVML